MPSYLGRYILLSTLGKGGYSKVKLAQDKETQKFYAVKLHKTQDPDFTEEVKSTVISEVQTILKLKQDNIIQIIDFFPSAEVEKKNGKKYEASCVIVEELAEGGELFFYVLNSGHFSEKLARYFFTQLLDGLQYMNQQGFAHRDLKPDNLLFDEKFTLKIADFGFAGPLKGRYNDGYMRTCLGTRPYMAPEIHQKQPYKGELVDVFSAAVCLFIMVSGTPPFNEARKEEFYYKFICAKKWPIYWKYHYRNKPAGDKFFSEEFKDLMQHMLAYDAAERITLAQIREHPWMKGPVPSYEEVYEECKVRKEINVEKKEEERQAKLQQKKNYGSDRHRGVDVEGEELKIEEEKDRPLLKSVEEFIRLPGKNYQFFVKLHPERIQAILQNINELQQQAVKDLADEEEKEEEEEAQTEEDKLAVTVDKEAYKFALEKEVQGLTFSVKVLSCSQKGVYALDFRQKLGEIYDFVAAYKMIQSHFLPYIAAAAAEK